MKKLGVLLAMAFLAQGAAADKAGYGFTNLAVLVAETGASSSWVTHEFTTEQKVAAKLDQHVRDVNEQLSRKLEQRFSAQLEAVAEQ
ncbi:hypothetical protein G8764_15885 [Pseudomaricurvus alcaniphilus]|uniref:hypothetical protein n=1 Tax=Pseudomaricurvus alcaniphilus TaxID=1166482 RepID=UPI0014097FB5|nr:hypothetical protein [Pseudomaricurvus alcaniphilus]NHN38790.1 hypothetical protein [Pseudomaricurvus alcaniphilus]